MCYENMLSREDWEIFDWVQGREVPKGEIERRVVARIRDSNSGLESRGVSDIEPTCVVMREI